jgi:hypothetical protein
LTSTVTHIFLNGDPASQRELADKIFYWMGARGQPLFWIFGDKPWVVNLLKAWVFEGFLPTTIEEEACDGADGDSEDASDEIVWEIYQQRIRAQDESDVQHMDQHMDNLMYNTWEGALEIFGNMMAQEEGKEGKEEGGKDGKEEGGEEGKEEGGKEEEEKEGEQSFVPLRAVPLRAGGEAAFAAILGVVIPARAFLEINNGKHLHACF